MSYVRTCYVPTNPFIPSSRCKHFVILRPVEILLHKRTNPRVPPCEPLQKYVFKIYDVNHFIQFFKKKSLRRALNFFLFMM